MNIEGTYTLQASAEDVWHNLMDQEALLRTVPGIERLERIDKDTYTIALHIKHAPLMGSYTGRVIVTEQQHPYHYRLLVEGEGRQSTISGQGTVHLNTRESNTIVAYKGTLTLGKLGTLLPHSLVKGAAKLLIQQYFTALADQLRINHQASSPAIEDIQEASIIKQPGGSIVILPPPSTAYQSARTRSMTRRLVHLLGLGAGDPVQEEVWEQRARRVGIVTGFLFLVWVGTRLPGRRKK